MFFCPDGIFGVSALYYNLKAAQKLPNLASVCSLFETYPAAFSGFLTADLAISDGVAACRAGRRRGVVVDLVYQTSLTIYFLNCLSGAIMSDLGDLVKFHRTVQ